MTCTAQGLACLVRVITPSAFYFLIALAAERLTWKPEKMLPDICRGLTESCRRRPVETHVTDV
jgi:hypothetical protein